MAYTDHNLYFFSLDQFGGTGARQLADSSFDTFRNKGLTLTLNGTPKIITLKDDDDTFGTVSERAPGQTVTAVNALGDPTPGISVGQTLELANALTLTGGGKTFTIWRMDSGSSAAIKGVIMPPALIEYFKDNPNTTFTITGSTIDNYGSGDMSYSGNAAPCFTPGTMIEGDNGAVAVETLKVGDLVMTKDHGMQPVRWVGSRHITATLLAIRPDLRPIRIRAGALGSSLPSQDLLVSPFHRMLVSSALAEEAVGNAEVLVAARNLVDLDGVEVATDVEDVTYIHFMCDQHEVVVANGADSESLNIGLQTAQLLSPESWAEITRLFPQLGTDSQPTARPAVAGDRGRDLVRQHIAAELPLAG